MILIDRDELIERMERNRLHSANVEFIKSQNPVEAVRVVHGKWLNPDGDFEEAACSVCGYRVLTTYEGSGSELVFNAATSTLCYCSRCGAKMDEEADDCETT